MMASEECWQMMASGMLANDGEWNGKCEWNVGEWNVGE